MIFFYIVTTCSKLKQLTAYNKYNKASYRIDLKNMGVSSVTGLL